MHFETNASLKSKDKIQKAMRQRAPDPWQRYETEISHVHYAPLDLSDSIRSQPRIESNRGDSIRSMISKDRVDSIRFDLQVRALDSIRFKGSDRIEDP